MMKAAIIKINKAKEENLLVMTDKAYEGRRSGWLKKKAGAKGKLWRDRYCSIRDGTLYWWPNENTSNEPKGIMHLEFSAVVKVEKPLQFALHTEGSRCGKYFFKAATEGEKQSWIASLVQGGAKPPSVNYVPPGAKPVEFASKTVVATKIDKTETSTTTAATTTASSFVMTSQQGSGILPSSASRSFLPPSSSSPSLSPHNTPPTTRAAPPAALLQHQQQVPPVFSQQPQQQFVPSSQSSLSSSYYISNTTSSWQQPQQPPQHQQQFYQQQAQPLQQQPYFQQQQMYSLPATSSSSATYSTFSPGSLPPPATLIPASTYSNTFSHPQQQQCFTLPSHPHQQMSYSGPASTTVTTTTSYYNGGPPPYQQQQQQSTSAWSTQPQPTWNPSATRPYY